MKVIVVGTLVASVGGSFWRQMPSAPALVVRRLPMNVVEIVVPAAPNPQTMLDSGARCSTIPSPRVLDKVNGSKGCVPTGAAALAVDSSTRAGSIFGRGG